MFPRFFGAIRHLHVGGYARWSKASNWDVLGNASVLPNIWLLVRSLRLLRI